jgi:hypothetical protein
MNRTCTTVQGSSQHRRAVAVKTTGGNDIDLHVVASYGCATRPSGA